jgi:RHS repeat-associated protein
MSALAGALSLSLLGPWLNPLPASAQPAVQQQETGDLSRPDSVSASLTARSSGRSVEDLSQRTESAQTFANPDGTWTLESFPRAKFAKSGGGDLVEINTDLRAGDGEVSPVASPADLSLSLGEAPGADGAADLVTIEAAGAKGVSASLTVGWEGALPEPSLQGSSATYDAAADAAVAGENLPTDPADIGAIPDQSPEASPEADNSGADITGADVVVETTQSGFSHNVVLNEAPAEPLELRFPLGLSDGLTAKIVQTGVIEVRDAAGKLVFFGSIPLMWDSVVDEHSGLFTNTVPVDADLETSPEGPVLVLRPDQGFLTDPDRKYPVTVDPTWSTATTVDTFVQSDTASPQHGSGELRVGTFDGGVTKARSYLKFVTDSITGKDIISADLQVHNWWSWSCDARNTYAQRVTGFWDSTTLVWANQPAVTTSGQLALSSAKGFSSACPAGDVLIPVTNIIKDWAVNPGHNYGIRLVAGSESDNYGWRRYRSNNYASGDNAVEPHLKVTYNQTPNTPSGVSYGVGQTVAWTDPATGTTTRYATTTKPAFSAIVTDPDGGTLRTAVDMFDGATPVYSKHSGTAVASGGRSTMTPSTATPALVNGKTYTAKVWSYDARLYSKSSVNLVFAVDVAAPAAPSISASAMTNGQWTSPKPASNTFTFTGASTDTAKFQYSQDGAAFKDTLPATGTPAKQTLGWVAEGSHSLAVRSVDRAGNISGVTTFSYGAGSAALTSPAAGAKSTDVFAVKGSAPPAGSGTTVTPTVYWRAAGASEPSDFSASNGSKTGWTAVKTLDPVTGTNAVDVNEKWSAAAAAKSLGKDRVPVLLDVQVCFAYSSPAMTRCTRTSDPNTHTSVVRLPHAFGQGFPTANAGPGQVALWTGEFNSSATDVSVSAGGTGLELSRSYSSLAGVDDTSIFGPGWNASADVADAGIAGIEVVDNTLFDGTLALVSGDGEALIYRQSGNGRVQDKAGLYTAVDDDTAEAGNTVEITGTGTGAKIIVTAPDNTVTVFTPLAYTANVATQWAAASVTEPGTAGATSFTRDSQGRITRILAPAPEGVTCPATGTLNAGCRALRLEYATTTTAAGETQGDIAGQLKAVWFDAYNPTKSGGPGMDSVKVADYAYDGSKRLRKATDSRSGRSTAYNYGTPSSSGAPLLTEVTPAGEAKYTLGYGSAPNVDATSLLNVNRQNPDNPETGAAVQTARFVYGIDLTQAANPDLPSLTEADVALWDQGSDPRYGAAVFSADKPIGTSDHTQVAGGDWKYASLSFMDEEGYTVNTAAYGAGAWQIGATDYQDGNTVRSFTPAAIANMRQAAADQSLPAGATLGSHNQFATITRYNTEVKTSTELTTPEGSVVPAGTVLTAAGTFVTDVWSPVKPTGPDGVPARLHTHTTYDEGAPNQGINPATVQPYNLPTTATVTTAAAETGSPDPADPLPAGEPVLSTQKHGYDPIDGASVTGPTSGWTLRAATTTTTVMPDPADNITSKTRYDDRGRAVETRQPSSNGTDAGTTLTEYYTAGTGTAGCGNKAEWSGLPCTIRTAEATPTKPSTQTTGYTMFLIPTQELETVTGATRTTNTTYLADGQVDTVTTTTTGLGTLAEPGSKKLYNPDTGKETDTLALNPAGTETSRTTTAYDAWGRTVSYKDAGGAVTTTVYTPTGDPATVTTPYGTTAYTYDGTDAAGKEERRGNATSMTITKAGPGSDTMTFTAAYNAASQMTVQTLPAGITQTREYDDLGQLTGLGYTGKITNADGTAGTGPWIAWSRSYDVTGRVVGESTPDGVSLTANAAAYARTFTYDQASRLTLVQDRTSAEGTVLNTDPAEGAVTPCETRAYGYDHNGNRTSLSTSASGTDGTCPATATAGKQWTYDAADRVQTGANNTGAYTHDAFGRQTLIPAADTPKGAAAGNLTLSYYPSDAAHTITQAGTTTTFALDPESRRSTATTGTTVETNGYTDDSDSPGWVTETNGTTSTTTRYESTIGGDLGLTITGTDVKIGLRNPHQDIVSTITLPTTGDAEGIDSWADYDEYGNQTGTSPNTGPSKYGWLGTNQRATDDSGLLLMGARLYNPATGLFTSVDPVVGGNTTDYTYPQDPINKSDITGLAWWFAPILIRAAWSACQRYCASAGRAIYNSFNYVAPKVRHYANHNPYIRYGMQSHKGTRRFSMGATTKHWNKSGFIKRQFTRFHVHVERGLWDVHINTKSGPRWHRFGGRNHSG